MRSSLSDGHIKGKKAQITLFIIIGIIILFSVITLFYIRSRAVKEDLEVGVEEALEIPSWAKEVESFVETCIRDTAIKAFKKIGEHGGYIDFEDYYLSESYFNIDLDDPTESDAVSFSTKTKTPTAYWWYMATPNNCEDCIVTSIDPSLPFIEQQVNRYINRELPLCINNFSVFRSMGFQFETGNIITTTKINLNNVDITVERPTEIILGDRRTRMDTLKTTLDLNFYHDYMAAALIAYHQTTSMFLEDILMHLISVYSSTPDSEKIPPISSIDSKGTVETWKKRDVKERITENLLGSNIPMIQINKTKSATRVQSSDPLLQGLYETMFLDFLPGGFENLEIKFLYNPEWEIYFGIIPSSGDTIKPVTTKTDDSGFGFFPTVTTNFYEFYYDVSFPVIIIIKDHSSLTTHDSEGYMFMFALEANVRGNKNLYLWNQGEGTTKVDYSGVRIDLKNTNVNATACSKINNSRWICPLNNQVYTDPMECSNYCQKRTTSIIDPTLTPSLFCDYEQRISGNITINTFDAKTNGPLKDVQIIFGCGNYRKCPMESTDDNSIYKSKFPICIGDGYLVLEKEGYLPEYVSPISTQYDTPLTYNIYLEPIREKQVEAVYINITNLFRIKRKLYSKTGNNLLDDLYYETRPSTIIVWPPLPIIAWGHGILKELYAKSPNNEIAQHTQKILYARNLIKDIEYYHQLDVSKVIDAAYIAQDAAESAWELVNDGTITINEPYRSQLEQDFIWLNKEIENIQFLRGSEPYQQSNINYYRTKATPLKEGDIATVSYQKVKENIYEQNLPKTIAQAEYGNGTSISLVPGTYSVNIILRNNNGMIIPAQDIYPQMNYTPALIGGAELNNQTGLWIISKTELDSSNKVKFYFFKIDDPEQVEDFAEIGAVANYSKRYRAYIEPEFLP